jgi:hypothetical protein
MEQQIGSAAEHEQGGNGVHRRALGEDGPHFGVGPNGHHPTGATGHAEGRPRAEIGIGHPHRRLLPDGGSAARTAWTVRAARRPLHRSKLGCLQRFDPWNQVQQILNQELLGVGRGHQVLAQPAAPESLVLDHAFGPLDRADGGPARAAAVGREGQRRWRWHGGHGANFGRIWTSVARRS